MIDITRDPLRGPTTRILPPIFSGFGGPNRIVVRAGMNILFDKNVTQLYIVLAFNTV